MLMIFPLSRAIGCRPEASRIVNPPRAPRREVRGNSARGATTQGEREYLQRLSPALGTQRRGRHYRPARPRIKCALGVHYYRQDSVSGLRIASPSSSRTRPVHGRVRPSLVGERARFESHSASAFGSDRRIGNQQ
jgi:hypothetical protein